MKKQRGGVKILTLVGILLIMTITLFIIVVVTKIRNDKDLNMENTKSNTISDSFTFSFLKNENNSKNMIYSPLSIKYALKMLQEGAKGNTLNQIESVVGSLNLPKYKMDDKKLVEEETVVEDGPFVKNQENKISLANGLFIRDTYFSEVKQSFTNILKEKYNAEITQDKFVNANNVNNWIENKTLGIIKNMLSDELVSNADLKLLLINALAIDISWKNEFETEKTYGGTFNLSNGTQMQATMMSEKSSSNELSYYIGKDVTAISKDLYERSEAQLEFLAIMPKKDLKEYINTLTIKNIDNITNSLKTADTIKAGVNLKIPKFSFDYDLDLKKDLINLGITDAFDEVNANFQNIANIDRINENLYVSKALHKANIDFSEKGIKAATITSFAMSLGAMSEEKRPIEITFDKPFLFIIRDKKTKEIWFTGTVYEPNKWENDKAEYNY